MAEYINRNALLESIREGAGTSVQKIFAALCVADVPTADVVEVVRCKDCRSYEPHGNGKAGRCRNPKCKGLHWANDSAVTEKGKSDMARCEDCIHQECCIRFAGARTLLCGDKADERCKMFKSTADFAPRSEVAREIFADLWEMFIPEKSTDGLTYYFDMAELIELKNKYVEPDAE